MKSVQKVVLNGRSAQITIIRAMLFALDLRPGDLVECENTDDGVLHIRPWKSAAAPAHMAPTMVPPNSPLVNR